MMSFSFSLMLQSTSLLRGKTGAGTAIPQDEMSFNPLPSCEGRRPLRAHHCRAPRASIHLPLAREDPAAGKRCRNLSNASIHFPLAREDNPMYSRCASLSLLQSTSLLRGKTARARMTDRLQRMLQSTSLLRGKTFLQCSS